MSRLNTHTLLLAWLLALNAIGLVPWTYGPLTFAGLVIATGALWLAGHHHTPNHDRLTTARWPGIVAGVFALANLVLLVAGFLINPDWIIDIAANTYAAVEHVARGDNPHTHTSQLWVEHFPANTPHVASTDGQVTMFGLPYYRGYPYFPAMMLTYLPAYLALESYAAIRLTHAVLIAINLWAIKTIIDRVVADAATRRQTLLLAFIAYLGVVRYMFEAITLGVTDLLLSTWLLLAMAALSHQRWLLCGICLGLAQASKLLPAPLALLAISWYLWHLPGRHSLKPLLTTWLGYGLASLLVITPFLLWHPEGFLTATILYYLTHHHSGDSTSLWYFLPDLLKTPWLVAGLLVTLSAIPAFTGRQQVTLTGCMAAIFTSYALFMAFSKMSHLNYLWGVLPLGSLALALLLAGKQQASASR